MALGRRLKIATPRNRPAPPSAPRRAPPRAPDPGAEPRDRHPESGADGAQPKRSLQHHAGAAPALRRRCADATPPPPPERNPLAPPRDGSTPRADRYPPPFLFPISYFPFSSQSALGQRASLVERLVC